MASVVRNVRDIQGDQRRWLEGVLGHSLEDDPQVFIMVLKPGVVPDEEALKQARAGMENTFADAAKHAQEHGVAAGEIDEVVDEVMDRIRYEKS